MGSSYQGDKMWESPKLQRSLLQQSWPQMEALLNEWGRWWLWICIVHEHFFCSLDIFLGRIVEEAEIQNGNFSKNFTKCIKLKQQTDFVVSLRLCTTGSWQVPEPWCVTSDEPFVTNLKILVVSCPQCWHGVHSFLARLSRGCWGTLHQISQWCTFDLLCDCSTIHAVNIGFQ